mmetsp:Transcript_115002/g.330338  ORF Transcript_115002/g.330338 Transcript_115002/m.330338 type:complete len:200 (+) Transcript_115002:3259-3858(+)
MATVVLRPAPAGGQPLCWRGGHGDRQPDRGLRRRQPRDAPRPRAPALAGESAPRQPLGVERPPHMAVCGPWPREAHSEAPRLGLHWAGQGRHHQTRPPAHPWGPPTWSPLLTASRGGPPGRRPHPPPCLPTMARLPGASFATPVLRRVAAGPGMSRCAQTRPSPDPVRRLPTPSAPPTTRRRHRRLGRTASRRPGAVPP